MNCRVDSLRACVRLCATVCVVMLAAGTAFAQAGNGEKGVINFLAPIEPDPLLQHSKETYVLNGCAYCHGVDLKVRNGEAADLLHSSIVGADDNGSLLGPLLRTGIPQTAKLSPMPQFSDLSNQQIADLVRWIHHARQEGRYQEVMEAEDLGAGNAVAGKAYFDKNCGSCHSAQGDLAGLAKKYDANALKTQMLRPEFVDAPQSWKMTQLEDTKTTVARQKHLALLENYTPEDVANLLAYLGSRK